MIFSVLLLLSLFPFVFVPTRDARRFARFPLPRRRATHGVLRLGCCARGRPACKQKEEDPRQLDRLSLDQFRSMMLDARITTDHFKAPMIDQCFNSCLEDLAARSDSGSRNKNNNHQQHVAQTAVSMQVRAGHRLGC